MPRNATQFKWNILYDEILSKLRTSHSEFSWSEIAERLQEKLLEIPGHAQPSYPSARQCRERWNDRLDPNVSREPLTQQETIDALRYKKQGKGYAEIGRILNHSSNQIKKLYYQHNKEPSAWQPLMTDSAAEDREDSVKSHERDVVTRNLGGSRSLFSSFCTSVPPESLLPAPLPESLSRHLEREIAWQQVPDSSNIVVNVLSGNTVNSDEQAMSSYVTSLDERWKKESPSPFYCDSYTGLNFFAPIESSSPVSRVPEDELLPEDVGLELDKIIQSMLE